MSTISDIFASMVFNDSVMRERLPKETYKALRKTMSEGKTLPGDIAGIVANAMKDWAIEKGATHFTHWFQPMTGITAEKHDSFISPVDDGHVIMEFSGKELVKGEPDASSFPSGGLRATFEARGYTAWDPTSYAFIREKTLCIPTVFCSFGGEALDKKTPLLKSIEAINKQATRIIRLFGVTNVKKVNVTVGAEQEYFLIDNEVYKQRRDLIYTGRTLFGSRPPKTQELDDHYFGSIKPRVKDYMNTLNEELWKLGILAKTEHNEAAPAQHELAPVFTDTNKATDHNQITMDVMKKVAGSKGLVCLLHEKPFSSVAGSGKHNNWSLCTDTGINLLEPGSSPYENAQFLLFLCAVIRAVDEHQDLLRISVATAGNDHRLGAAEAPPAIISMFLGTELTEILNAIETGSRYDGNKSSYMEIGVHSLPNFPKDNTDRNRTSPFAFTGNKFEFRMPGASLSISGPNIILNTIVADVLMDFADKLEKAHDSGDFKAQLNNLIRTTIKEHKRIIFNGNGYTNEWRQEAKARGLLDLASTPEALAHYTDKKNIDLFARHNIFTEAEVQSRRDILLENYCKMIAIEAATMVDMAKKDILPAGLEYTRELCDMISAKAACGLKLSADSERETATELATITDNLHHAIRQLEADIKTAAAIEDLNDKSVYLRDTVKPDMALVRENADAIELLIPSEYYPYPDYGTLLFSV
ncbi:MAG: glutamine synthetase type III [Ruminococcaceae bacterium]|nr:glutamine synthetase type III [Oscillospiraceae bacterium]